MTATDFTANSAGDFPDNAERYSEFCRAAIEIVKHVWPADVIHCHDWQTALVPVLLRSSYGDDPASKRHSRGVHDSQHGLSRTFSEEMFSIARAFLLSLYNPGGLEFYGSVNFLKGGLVYSDYLTTVSKRYAQEIQTPEFGYGLDGVVRGRADRMVGILNGVDYSAWSPDKDKLIPMKYSAKDMSGKQVCKQALLELFGIAPEHAARPVIGIVSRFADQKGFDLIAEKAFELMKEDVSLAVLGSGDRKYEELFQAMANTFPGRIGVKIAYDNEIAHKIEAGADMFLMPSRYEPCGLNQIYSLKYGTVPIVRATGGLDDTVEPFDLEHGTGTGFKFAEYSGAAMMFAIRQALHHCTDERIWRRIQLNGMAKDFSWKGPAAEYAKVYEAALTLRGAGQAGRNQMSVTTSN